MTLVRLAAAAERLALGHPRLLRTPHEIAKARSALAVEAYNALTERTPPDEREATRQVFRFAMREVAHTRLAEILEDFRYHGTVIRSIKDRRSS